MHGMRWTPDQDAALRSVFAKGLSDIEIGARLGRTDHSILQRRKVLELYRTKTYVTRRMGKKTWIALATDAALAADLPLDDVLSRARGRKVTLARWQAWKAGRAAGYCIAGIGAASGFHHTSVIFGLRRLDAGAAAWDRTTTNEPKLACAPIRASAPAAGTALQPPVAGATNALPMGRSIFQHRGGAVLA